MGTPDALPSPPPQTDASAQAVRAAIDQAYALGVPRGYARRHRLRRAREPRHLAFIGYDTQGRTQWLSPQAAKAWLGMRGAAADAGIELQVVSAFRSVAYQLGILRRKLASGQTMEEILRVSAAPGYSEHHTGHALDLTAPGFAALESEFERSPAFDWLGANAASHGFRMSYPHGNPHGIAYEPWHWCWHARPRAP